MYTCTCTCSNLSVIHCNVIEHTERHNNNYISSHSTFAIHHYGIILQLNQVLRGTVDAIPDSSWPP